MAAGFVYAFRYGDGDLVKIGRAKDLDRRRMALQVAHSDLLVLADFIDHDDYAEGERYLHALLRTRRVGQGVSSREHFDVGQEELTEAFEETRQYLEYELPRRRELMRYEPLDASEDILPATENVLGVKERLGQLRASRALLQPEQDRLDEEIRELQMRQLPERERLNRKFHELEVEEARLVTSVKLAIGPAGGIDGVATWKTVATRRRFDQESLKADDPELFEAYRTAFDKPRFRRERPAEYQTHMSATMRRVFRWVDDDDNGRDDEASAPAISRGLTRLREFGRRRT